MNLNTEESELFQRVFSNAATESDYLELFYQMRGLVITIAQKVIKFKFTSVPISIDDVFSTAYYVFINCINDFKLRHLPHKNFVKYLSIRINFAIINECRSYISLGHSILNFAQEIENEHTFKDDYCHVTHSQAKAMIENIMSDSNEIQKKIILLKLRGYSHEEIANMLNTSLRTIEYQWKKIKLSQTT